MHKIFKTTFSIFTITVIIGCTSEENKKIIRVNGTVENILLVAENTWQGNISLKYKVITLSSGRKYRLNSEQGKGIGKGFDVEISLSENTKPHKKGEYEVNSIKILAIPMLGKKVKYPVTNPPVVIGNINNK